jgi:hypothetical protein
VNRVSSLLIKLNFVSVVTKFDFDYCSFFQENKSCSIKNHLH